MMVMVRFRSGQEYLAFIAWLNFQGITRGDIAQAIASDYRAAQEFLGTALLKFRAEQERRAAVDTWLDLLELESEVSAGSINVNRY